MHFHAVCAVEADGAFFSVWEVDWEAVAIGPFAGDEGAVGKGFQVSEEEGGGSEEEKEAEADHWRRLAGLERFHKRGPRVMQATVSPAARPHQTPAAARGVWKARK